MIFKNKKVLFTLVVLAVIVLAVIYSSRPDPVAVVLSQVNKGMVESTVANTRAGTVKTCNRALLAPTIGGQISKLPVKEGEKVKKGQILLELWNDDLSAKAQLAEKEIHAAKAKAVEACVSAQVASREATRITKLKERGLVSEEAVDRAQGDAKSRNAACKAASVAVEVASENLAVAKAALEKTILRAPFDGTVAEINGELGEFVTPSPVGIPTLPAVDLVDNTCFYVLAPIDEVDAPSIQVDMPVRISLDAFSDIKFEGKVSRVASYVLDREKQARTVDIEVNFVMNSKTSNLLPGYSADVEVILSKKENVLRIPTEAVMEHDYVMIYSPDKKIIAKRKITTGISNWVFTEVVDGLKEGDTVVTSVDREGVEDGASVRPENSK